MHNFLIRNFAVIFIAIILSLMLLAVIYFDVTKFIIPNELNLGFIILYPAFLVLTPQHIEWWWSLTVMLCFFGVGYIIFRANIMGGGDIKLLIALSLWIGWHLFTLEQFLLNMALAGGLLALVLIIIRVIFIILRKLKLRTSTPPKIFRMREPLPYGVAIVYAFAYVLWTNQIYGLKVY